MRKKRIKSISFFYKGERVVVESNTLGTFRVPVTSVLNGKVQTTYKNLTAREVISHRVIKECDPVLTLTNGEKIRVYQGGDSSYLPAMIEGIVLKHDGPRRSSFSSQVGKSLWSSPRQLEFPWEDLYGDAD